MYLHPSKYSRWYDSIIKSAQNRKLPSDLYTEIHHIVPKSFYKSLSNSGWLDGDPHDPLNLVSLTSKEHWIAHLLLTKMTYGTAKAKMMTAVWRMANVPKNTKLYKISSIRYEALRLLAGKAIKQMWKNPYIREKIIEAQILSITDERREKARKMMNDRWAVASDEDKSKWKENLKLGTIAASARLDQLTAEEKQSWILAQRQRGLIGGPKNAERIRNLNEQELEKFKIVQTQKAHIGGKAAKEWMHSLSESERQAYLKKRWDARRAKLSAMSEEEQEQERAKRQDAAKRAAAKRNANRLVRKAQINCVNGITTV